MKKLVAKFKPKPAQPNNNTPGTGQPPETRGNTSQPNAPSTLQMGGDGLSPESPVSFSSFPDGVALWHDSIDAKVDVCFVHGLTGNRDSTWTAHGQPWPKMLLPPKLGEARILTYGYDAYVVRKSVASSNRLIDHATNLLSDLTTDREIYTASSRPIIFVAHSLGGLVCKEAILLSRNNPDAHLRNIFDCVKGIIFMGTPHKGSWMADWMKIPALALDILETNNQFLESIQVGFWAMIRELREAGRHIEVTCFFEELPLLGFGKVVSKESATLEGYKSLSIHANHSDMVKFGSTEDNGFKRVVGELMRWKADVRAASEEQKDLVMDEKDRQFLDIFSVTDPHYDMKRILLDKGELLQGSYGWILEHPDFSQWRDDKQSRLLWIKGDPGKGKTMLLCGIIDALTSTEQRVPLSYFFCQGTDSRINNATAVLRGITYLLLKGQPSLILPMRKKYQTTDKDSFKDVNAWVVLSDALTDILQDQSLTSTYVVIDALDECQTGLQQFLNFIAQKSSALPHIKWIVSSRNRQEIEERLKLTGQIVELSLEQNSDSISAAVAMYIKHKVCELTKLKGYNPETEAAVQIHLFRNANDTFLWVALVCEQLEKTSRFQAIAKLTQFPPKLDALYQRMMEQVTNSDDVVLCRPVLALMASVYGPISLSELAFYIELLEDKTDEDLADIIRLCGSFLTLQGKTVSFVHQSAKDFLLSSASLHQIFPSGMKAVHHAIFSRSLLLMDDKIQYNMYRIPHPGMVVGEVIPPDDDNLAAVRYSCAYWMDHASDMISQSSPFILELRDIEQIFVFLTRHFLHWLESLSLLQKIPEGVLSIKRLLEAVQTGLLNNSTVAPLTLTPKRQLVDMGSSKLTKFLKDADKFAVKYRPIIERAPLQIYGAALVFCATNSEMKKRFWNERLAIIQTISGISEDRDPCLQILEGHKNSVTAAVFSQNEKLLASTSYDGALRIWRVTTGVCVKSLEGHTRNEVAVAFSPKGDTVASASDEHEVRLWDITLGVCIRTFPGHKDALTSLTFSPNGKIITSTSRDHTIRLWDVSSGASKILNGHRSLVRCVAFTLPNGKTLASASSDDTVRLWDTAKGTHIKTINGEYSMRIQTIVFSSDAKTITSLSEDGTVRHWNVNTEACERALRGNSGRSHQAAFSLEADMLAVAPHDDYKYTMELWDLSSRQLENTLRGHADSIHSLSFSPSGKMLASASRDDKIRIWDVTASPSVQKGQRHSDTIDCIAFSPDGKSVATSSSDDTVQIWDAATGSHRRTLECHGYSITAVTFSPDSSMVAFASPNGTVQIWDARTGDCKRALPVNAYGLIFSPNGKTLTTASLHRVQTWDIAEGDCIREVKTLFGTFPGAYMPHERLYPSMASWDHPDDKSAPRMLTNKGGDSFKAMDWGSLFSGPDNIRFSWDEELFVRDDWITQHGRNILWLPPDYRPECSALHKNVLVLGQRSGRITRLEFAPTRN